MENSDITRFTQAVKQHFALYPHIKIDLKKTPGLWFKELEEFPISCVIEAFYEARKQGNPNFMPSCAVIRNFAKSALKREYSNEKQERTSTGHHADYKSKQKKLDKSNKFEQLARYWEQENTHWRKHPQERPQDPGKKRLKQFWYVWANEIPTKISHNAA